MENKQIRRRRLATRRAQHRENGAGRGRKRLSHKLRHRVRGLGHGNRRGSPRLFRIGCLIEAIGMAGFVLALIAVLAARCRGAGRNGREAGQATAGRQNHRQKAGKRETG